MADILLLCGASASLLLSCILWSSHKQAWFDEIFTWKEVSDPSLWHLYSAIQHGVDGGQPLFYTTAWIWVRMFGAGVLSLRMYSSLGMCGALVVAWLTLRRFYGLWATAFGLLGFWGTCGLLLEQNVEARFYGLFMVTVAVSFNFYARAIEKVQAPSPGFLLFAFLSQTALVFSHVLGIVYGALILFGLILVDAARQNFRPKLYLAYATGWLPLALWLPAIRSSMAVGKPRSWLTLPHLIDLRSGLWFSDASFWRAYLNAGSHSIGFELVTRASEALIHGSQAAVLVFAILKIRKNGWRAIGEPKGALILLAYLLLAMLPMLFVLSYAVAPVFAPRYFLPSGIGMAILLTACAGWLGADSDGASRPSMRFVWAAIVIFFLVLPSLTVMVLKPAERNWAYLDLPRLQSAIPKDTPVVATWEGDYAKLMRFAQDPARHYYYLLDWPSALAGQQGSVVGYHLMQAYRANGYFAQNIEESHDFLCHHSDFVVLDSPNAHGTGDPPNADPEMNKPNWFDQNIRANNAFAWTSIASFDGPAVVRRLVKVHRHAALDFCTEP